MESQAQAAAQAAKQNPGWLKEKEGRLLFALAAMVPGNGSVVEIGSAEGKSTIWMANGLKVGGRGEKLYAIDPHQNYLDRLNSHQEFLRNMERAGVKDVVVGMEMTSEQASQGWERPIRLLFIDGDHEWESVQLDFELWSRHLIDGGVIAFHDCLRANTGPTKVFAERIVDSGWFDDFSLRGSIAYGRRAGAVEAGTLSQSPLRRRYTAFTLHLFLKAVGRSGDHRLPKPLVNLFRALVPH